MARNSHLIATEKCSQMGLGIIDSTENSHFNDKRRSYSATHIFQKQKIEILNEFCGGKYILH
jgi:hypothetical protein